MNRYDTYCDEIHVQGGALEHTCALPKDHDLPHICGCGYSFPFESDAAEGVTETYADEPMPEEPEGHLKLAIHSLTPDEVNSVIALVTTRFGWARARTVTIEAEA